MSFVFKCRPTAHSPPVALTALVGRDEQLYWIARDLKRVVGHHPYRSNLRAGDVLGKVPRLAGHYCRQIVLTHATVLERLRKVPNRIYSRQKLRQKLCHRLADLLEDSTLAVRSVREHPARFLVYPSVVEAVEKGAADGHQPFTLWLEFFKQRVFRDLYQQPLYSVAPFEDVPDGLDQLLDADALCASLVPAIENHGQPPILTACVPASSSHSSSRPSSPCSTLCSSPPRLSRESPLVAPSRESTLPSTLHLFHEGLFYAYWLAGP